MLVVEYISIYYGPPGMPGTFVPDPRSDFPKHAFERPRILMSHNSDLNDYIPLASSQNVYMDVYIKIPHPNYIQSIWGRNKDNSNKQPGFSGGRR
jgi:hypothetical protein